MQKTNENEQKNEVNYVFCDLLIIFMFGMCIGSGLAYYVRYRDVQLMRNNLSEKVWSMEKLLETKPTKENSPILHDPAVADILVENVKVLCMVLTGPQTHKSKAKHVKATWGRRCNKLLFMSTAEDKTLPTVKLNSSDGRDYLWGKTKLAFQYVYENYEGFDWILKADDDTYVIVENLRYFLTNYSSREPQYLGTLFKTYRNGNYLHGGAGYVISQKTLEILVTEGLKDPEICSSNLTGSEDVEMSKCMKNLNIKPVDTRDKHLRYRFLPFIPADLVAPLWNPNIRWFKEFNYYRKAEEMTFRNICSEYAISFHWMEAKSMYFFDFLIYHFNAFGILKRQEQLDEELRIKYGIDSEVDDYM